MLQKGIGKKTNPKNFELFPFRTSVPQKTKHLTVGKKKENKSMFTLENSIKFKIFRFLKNIFKKKFFTANNWINFKIAQKNYKPFFFFFNSV